MDSVLTGDLIRALQLVSEKEKKTNNRIKGKAKKILNKLLRNKGALEKRNQANAK